MNPDHTELAVIQQLLCLKSSGPVPNKVPVHWDKLLLKSIQNCSKIAPKHGRNEGFEDLLQGPVTRTRWD
jgi:hypothetical protein